MDDTLGQPAALPPPRLAQEPENDDLLAEDDEGPDWTKLKSFASSSKPYLPKRGDKEFEPAAEGPTKLQTHSLNRAREAMFGALDGERGVSNKSVSYAVWYPALARAHVTPARGVLFNGMGHAVARPTHDDDEAWTRASAENRPTRAHKRTELLPEETLYLMERGSLFCWKDEPYVRADTRTNASAMDGGGVINDVDNDEDEHRLRGSPLSVQQAYADMIGRDELTLERYQAYAYLKRLGFNVLRAKPPSPSYPIPVSVDDSQSSASNPLIRILRPVMNLLSRLRSWLFGRIDWRRPLTFGWFGCAHNYASVYRTLRIMPSGHNIPLYVQPRRTSLPPPDATFREQPSPYEIFYHVYKPNTPFRKSSPPAPDYSLVIVNARTTPLPSLHELAHLWSFLPETGPPLPRARIQSKTAAKPPVSQSRRPPLRASHLVRLLSWLGLAESEEKKSPRKPHPFAVLKGGKKTIVIGVVDSGTVGFFRFSMGAFEETPMI